MARRPDSTLAWFATGLIVLSFPFAARATFDEYTGDAASDAALGEDTPVESPTPSDAGESIDAPGAERSTAFTDDSGGISCAVRRPHPGDPKAVAGGCALLSVAIALAMRRRLAT